MTNSHDSEIRSPDKAARQFKKIVTHVSDGVVVVAPDGEVLFVNPAAADLLGRSANELLGTNLGQPIVVGESVEMEVIRKDGSLVTVELRATRITWEDSPAMLASLRDITERVQAQLRIEHLNSVLRAIRQVNKLIEHETDPARLIQQACDQLVETRGYLGVWIALGDGFAPPMYIAQAGEEEGFESFAVSFREGSWPPCWKQHLDSNEEVIVLKPQEECEGCPLSQGYKDRRAMVTALRHGERLLGQLNVSIRGDLPANKEEKSLLTEVAAEISLALHTIETERLKQESEKRFKVITESSPDAIFIANRKGQYTYVNDAASKLLGYSTQELLNMNVVDLAVKERVQDVQKIFQEVLDRGGLFAELDLVRKDGTVVPVDLNSVLLPSGEIFASCRDLAERKEAEKLRRESEEKLKLAQRVAHIGHWELDAYDGTPIWSEEIFRIFGLDPGTAQPSFTQLETMIHPEEWSLLDQAVREGFEKGQPFDLVFRILRPGNKLGWMHAIGSTVRDEQGKVAKLFGTAQDITHQKQAEKELRESQQLLEGILDTIPVRVFWKDKDLIYLGCNAAFARDAGFSHQQDIVGKDDYQMGWRDQAELYRGDDREVIETGTPKILSEEPQTTPTGDTITLLTSKLPLRDVAGEIMGVLGTYLDITELKKLQAQLAQADRLSSTGMLAAGVAHEINNPLSYVLFNLETLTKDLPALLDEMRQFQARIDQNVDNQLLEDLVGDMREKMNPAVLDDILSRFKDALEGTHRIRDIARGLGTFSRVDKDKLVSVNLNHVIDVALNMAFNEIKYRAHLVKDFSKIPTIFANEGRLSQVFLNLIINATHAINEGDAENNEIRIRTWTEADNVCAEVRDTGSGIKPEHVDRLFDAFFTTKEVGVGSGLGLAISKSIVDSYKGTIQVNSEVGKGTSFVIRFPVQQEEVSVREKQSDRDKAETSNIQGRILIIDDEAGIRKAMARMLKGHETVQAANGEEAKGILEKDQAFDLVLCDMMMPEVSGVDIHKWLREKQPRLAEQFIFVTGGAFTPRAREYLDEVDNIRLEKPFDMANFKKIVSDRIRIAKGKKQPPPQSQE